MKHGISNLRRSLILVVVTLITACTFFTLMADGPETDIPITTDPTNNGSRSSSDVPILCSRQGGLLIFTFTETLGMVDCEVENTATEDVYSAVFQAVAGSSDSIYVSMAPGDYEITLTCANTIYYGEYTIE